MTGMDRWRGPHSNIISATPGLDEYRQIHLAENNPGLWPATDGIQTEIPLERKIDGVAEVTLQSLVSPLAGRKQTKLAYKDEVNIFSRTLLYGGAPGWSRWYGTAEPNEKVGARAAVYIRRKDGVRAAEFRKQINRLAGSLAGTGVLGELRTQVFMPWNKKLWDTPDVSHDNPVDQRFHASLMLGFADRAARTDFFAGPELQGISHTLVPVVSAIHAYEVTDALTYVRDGAKLPHYEQ